MRAIQIVAGILELAIGAGYWAVCRQRVLDIVDREDPLRLPLRSAVWFELLSTRYFPATCFAMGLLTVFHDAHIYELGAGFVGILATTPGLAVLMRRGVRSIPKPSGMGPKRRCFEALAFLLPRTVREAFWRDWLDDRDEMMLKGYGPTFRGVVFGSRIVWELSTVVKKLIIDLLVGAIRPHL